MKTEMLHKVHVKEEVGLEFKFKNTKIYNTKNTRHTVSGIFYLYYDPPKIWLFFCPKQL